MAPSWFGSSKESLADLIAHKKYDKAIDILQAFVRDGVNDPRKRLQLADVLILGGRPKEAIPILSTLADEYAREGYAAKSVAMLKRLEKIAPGQPDVEHRLAQLIHKRLSVRPEPGPVSAGEEIGMEELGIGDAFASLSVPVSEPSPAPSTASAPGAYREELQGGGANVALRQPAGGAPLDADLVLEEPTPEAEEAGSPLFSGFSQEELQAVIAKLSLLSYEAGDIVVTEGQPGGSLFVLTTGRLKAFVRDGHGRNTLVREMPEGSFFGEISIVTGQPRTATITCATRCELLELDTEALKEIIALHPHVREVILDAHQERAGSKAELTARGRA